MTSTTPLVSSWYARERLARDPDGDQRDPYWLYALSNFGSLVSLLAYPFLIEPLIGLSAQRVAWTAGFGILRGLPGRRRRSRYSAATAVPATAARRVPAVKSPAIAGRRRLRWILLAAIPSGMLAAVTNLITTDLLSAPLLWVIPLAIYLGTFVVAFSERGRRALPVIIAITPAALTLLWIPLGFAGGWPIVPLLLIEYVGLAIVATALHGRLAGDRPPPEGLTGLLPDDVGRRRDRRRVRRASSRRSCSRGSGSTRSSSPPPRSCSPGRARRRRRPPPIDGRIARLLDGWAWRLVPYLLVAIGLIALMRVDGSPALDAAARWLMVGALVLLLGRPGARVRRVDGRRPRHGHVRPDAAGRVPGPQLLRPRAGVPPRRRQPDGADARHDAPRPPVVRRGPAPRARVVLRAHGPMGDLFAQLDDRAPMDVRVVGLGAGSLAAYERPGDDFRFYEIDPLIARVAEDPSAVHVPAGRAGVDVDPDRRWAAAGRRRSRRLRGPRDPRRVHVGRGPGAPHHGRGPGRRRADPAPRRDRGRPRVEPLLRPRAAGRRRPRGGRARRRAPHLHAHRRRGRGWREHLALARAGRPGESDELLGALTARGWSSPRVGEPLTDDFADLLRYLRLR